MANTKVSFRKRNGHFVGLEIAGHSGFAEEGQDIVCAGISCISQTAVLGIQKVAQVNTKYKINEKKGYLLLELPEDISDKEQEVCDIILQTAYLGIADLKQGFSKYIKLEVIQDVY